MGPAGFLYLNCEYLAVKEKIISAKQYKAVAESFSQVVKDENQKIVLKKS